MSTEHIDANFLATDDFFQTIFENSPQPMWVYDLETFKFLAVNNATVEHYGYTREEFLSMNIKEIRPPEEVSRLVNMISQVGLGVQHLGSWKHRRKDGSLMDVEISSHGILFGGRKARFVIVQDVTDRNRAEQELLETKNLLQQIVDTSPSMIFVIDGQGRAVFVNQYIAQYYETTPEQLLSKTTFDVHGSKIEAQGFSRDDQQVIRTRRTIVKDELNTAPNGEQHWFSTIKVPLIRSDGRVEVLGISTDITERKHAEEKLRESEDKFRSIFQQATDGIMIADGETKRLLEANKAICTMLGYTREEIVSLTVDDIHPKEDLPAIRSLFERHLRGEISLVADVPVLRKDGSVLYADINAARVTLSGRQCLVSIFRDITERKHAEEEVNRHNDTQAVINALLRLSLEEVPLENILKRALTLILSIPWLVSQSRGDIFLVENDPEVLVLKAQSGLDERIQKTCALVPFGKCICGRAALLKEIEFVERVDERHEISYDGIIPHGHYCVPIIFAERILGVINVYVNEGHKSTEREKELLVAVANTLAGIIVRRRAEESLLESEQKLQAITDTAADAIVLIDDEEKIVYWNASASSMLGYQPDEIKGKNILVIIPPRYRTAHITAFRKFVETGQGATLGKTYEVSALRSDGTEIPIELSISGIFLKGKWHSAGIIRNITERKGLEQQLVQAQKMEAVGQLSGGIAHDFNNILSAIVGYGEILRLKMKENDPLRLNVKYLLEAADRAAQLTHSLLAFSRKQILNPRPIDLNETILRVQKLLRRVIGEDIELKAVFKQNALTVNADSSQIEQVLMNLATNARDAMPHGGSFTIETDMTDLDDTFIRAHGYGEQGSFAVVSVIDTGTGMDEATRKRIFEPFFTTKAVGRGSGLGLSMVYGIIKQHQGYINVYSEPGEGTTFKIYLPLIKSEGEILGVIHDTPEERLPRGTETVLVAEDDTALRNLSRTVLEEFGYTVIDAEDGESAIKTFAEHKNTVQLVILDMIMPKKSGKEAYDEIKKIKPGIKALFVSGYTADKVFIEDLHEKGMEFVLKPVTPRELLKKVRALLDS